MYGIHIPATVVDYMSSQTALYNLLTSQPVCATGINSLALLASVSTLLKSIARETASSRGSAGQLPILYF